MEEHLRESNNCTIRPSRSCKDTRYLFTCSRPLTELQAITTYLSTGLLYAQTFKPALRAALPPLARMATGAVFAMANVQVLLGISTLLYLVPVPLAAAHQAGSVALLSAAIHLLVTLRRPGLAAQLLRRARRKPT